MKQDDVIIHRMSGPPASMSPEYFELRLALCAGERDLELRRKNILRSATLQVKDGQPRPKQQRTHSCKYPAGSRRINQSRRERNGSPGYRTGCDKPPCCLGLGVAEDRDGSSNSPRSLSAPQSRSSSWKKMRRPRDVRHFREVYGAGEAERGSSRLGAGVSLEASIVSKLHELKLLQDEDCCVVRSFSTSPRGIINRGDSFKRKSEALVGVPPPHDVTSGDVLLLPVQQTAAQQSRPQSWNTGNNASDCGAAEEEEYLAGETEHPLRSAGDGGLPSYTVLVMGAHEVGKTALLQQFMTSEFMAAIETSFDMECEKTVSVVLDGQETILNFVDLPISVQKECVQYAEIEAYLITYSITDKESFHYATNILQELRRQGRSDAAVILVANKNDLVRSRQITEEEGKSLCELMNCKYIEVSAALNHRVDELLVGLVQQIRLNPRRLGVKGSGSRSDPGAGGQGKHSGCLNAALTFIAELIRKRRSTSRSCENLWVL